jgi:hypothetical protein
LGERERGREGERERGRDRKKEENEGTGVSGFPLFPLTYYAYYRLAYIYTARALSLHGFPQARRVVIEAGVEGDLLEIIRQPFVYDRV